ncbi:MAG: hypothetical protein AAFY31_04475 [Pseudomonadota bacterium]
MPASDVLHPDGSDFDAFLQAELGEDENGVAVTVLSALARVGLEPWTEAKELARLGRKDAEVRLNEHLVAITDVPALDLASRSEAAKLVSLLPKRTPPVFAKTPQTTTISFPQVSLFWIALAIIAVAVIARILFLAQAG